MARVLSRRDRFGKVTVMAKRGGGRGGGKQGGGKGGSGKQGAGWPAKTNDGNKSGGGRDNNPPKGGKK